MKSIGNFSDFFDAVVHTNYATHFSAQTSLATAWNLSVSIAACRDWAVVTNGAELASQLRISKSNDPRRYDKAIQSACSEIEQIRRLANAFKHYHLNQHSSFSANKPSDLTILRLGYGQGPYGAGRFGVPCIEISTPQGACDFDMCAEKAFDFWSGFRATIS